jgi:hypothetical protein
MMLAALPAGGQQGDQVQATINRLREDKELEPLSGNPALDALAARYLEGMIEAKCLCPGVGGDAGADQVVDDVRAALQSDAPVVDAGLAVGYDQSIAQAMAITALNPANASAILGARMTEIGIATEVIRADEGWLAPPPGGGEPEIDLGGYTVVAIVTAGSGE